MILSKGWSIKVNANSVYLKVNGLARLIMLASYNNLDDIPHTELKTMEELKEHAIRYYIKGIKANNMLDGHLTPLIQTMHNICEISRCLSDKTAVVRKKGEDYEPCTLDEYWNQIKTEHASEFVPIYKRMTNAEVTD